MFPHDRLHVQCSHFSKVHRRARRRLRDAGRLCETVLHNRCVRKQREPMWDVEQSGPTWTSDAVIYFETH